ncbi:MAG TPA: AMP-binding protein [Myxococcota bacterium]|jgi:fatty-acyl-CoA synthase
MTLWNLADCLDEIAAIRGGELALAQGPHRSSWTETERRARNLAAWMVDQGASHQAKVALYSYNHPAYMEGVWAAMKAALAPVNVNYRYRAEELRYLLENADAEIVIVHQDFAPMLESVRRDLPKLRATLVVREPGSAASAESLGGADYEKVARTDRPAPEVTRSGDDLLLLYTGGTTGMPKGVMWRQHDLYLRLAGGGLIPPPPDLPAFREFVRNAPLRLSTLVAPPLMHGTGWFTAVIAWLTGGSVLMLDDPKRFDPADLWGVVTREKPTSITIVGDSFAKPMVQELKSGGGRYDFSSVRLIASSGVMWSEETKQALLAANPQALLYDSFSSSEAVGMGISLTTAAGAVKTARFQLGPNTRLFDETLQPLATAPGVRGLVGVGGPQPLGYYKDEAKSARTFVTVEGARFSIPGDWAIVNPDGVTLTLLGRGSVCINTGGEKVFPEEVEEAIKRYPGVKDAVVVGVPDEKWGEAITAVVSMQQGGLDAKSLIEFVKGELAAYKAPKHVVPVDEVYRSPSGKADFKRTREVALVALGLGR